MVTKPWTVALIDIYMLCDGFDHEWICSNCYYFSRLVGSFGMDFLVFWFFGFWLKIVDNFWNISRAPLTLSDRLRFLLGIKIISSLEMVSGVERNGIWNCIVWSQWAWEAYLKWWAFLLQHDSLCSQMAPLSLWVNIKFRWSFDLMMIWGGLHFFILQKNVTFINQIVRRGKNQLANIYRLAKTMLEQKFHSHS